MRSTIRTLNFCDPIFFPSSGVKPWFDKSRPENLRKSASGGGLGFFVVVARGGMGWLQQTRWLIVSSAEVPPREKERCLQRGASPRSGRMTQCWGERIPVGGLEFGAAYRLWWAGDGPSDSQQNEPNDRRHAAAAADVFVCYIVSGSISCCCIALCCALCCAGAFTSCEPSPKMDGGFFQESGGFGPQNPHPRGGVCHRYAQLRRVCLESFQGLAGFGWFWAG